MKKALLALTFQLLLTPLLFSQRLIEAVEAKNYEGVQQHLKNGEDVNKTNDKGQFPLWNAVWNEDTKMVALLLKGGADPKQTFKGKDAQSTCLEIAAQEGFLDIVKLLVESGANINIQDKEGDFALGEAAKGGFIEVASYLLANGADVSLKNAEGNNAQQLAKLAGQAKIEELLKQTRRG